MKKSYLILFLIFALFSCKTETKKKSKKLFTTYAEDNVFLDDIFRQIEDFKYSRNVADLTDYIETTGRFDPKYRVSSLVAFGSIQDSTTVSVISSFLKDNDANVKIAATFALGQIKCNDSEVALMKAYGQESALIVKEAILVSLGKCASKEGLDFVLSLQNENDGALRIALSESLSRFAERGITNDISSQRIIEILSNRANTEQTKLAASYAFARQKHDSTFIKDNLAPIYKSCDLIYTKLNILKVLASTSSNAVNSFFMSELNQEKTDYRIKIGILQALKKLDYNSVKTTFFSFSEDENLHLAIEASRFFVEYGSAKDANLYFQKGKKEKRYQIRTAFFAASLKHEANKEEISKTILAGYDAATDNYEKAALLKALGGNFSFFKQIESEMFASEIPVVKTAGIEALVAIRADKNFDNFAKNTLAETGEDVYTYFGQIFKNSILSGDVALICIASQAIRTESYNFRELYVNTYFLTQGINGCVLPRDIEAYYELIKTAKYINGTPPEEADIYNVTFKPTDWELVKSIPAEQKIRFTTEKGKFTLQLDINSSPASVSSFVQLVMDGFYDDKIIHRSVPNFVVQDGCPRGDGWGSPSFILRSEYSTSKFEEGSVGLASAGKDTESSQWFITHVPAPHLNGKYPNIGFISDGMDVVHNLHVGDRIIKAEVF